MPEGIFPSKYDNVTTLNLKDHQINGLDNFYNFLEQGDNDVDQFALIYHPLCSNCEE